ncbi:MAG: hypothetical protein UR46_C0010G0002 [Parcubacteria group bacterium GW2011_GWA1_33_6]|nr:MAG: hypothetical protein UR31_C0005G0008 [Parcubacteria group bacterium GW2011_GWA2_33_14]KKP54979.1 MAG: hypothetical protein UR46_C0010G0002 [Parcubacteria group bacterium GW2011_GWA1_33_6]
MENDKEIIFFGLTSFGNQRKRFGIKKDDRRKHFYIIGKTGTGKSNLMENMAIQDMQNGNGIAYIDPHGDGAKKLLDFVPANRIKDVIFLNPADLDFPIAFNVMEKVDFEYRHLVANGLVGVFKKVWPDIWSARMEYILNNSILALLEYPDSTLLGINRMLADSEYRQEVVSKIKDPVVKSFWVTEYARYTQRYEIEATMVVQNKIGQFVSNALVRNIIGQARSTINMRKVMDEGKILIIDLSKGKIGEDNSRLLGALLITKLQLSAMSRVDTKEEERKDFYVYIDEFQTFATESFANLFSEARKYRLNLIVGHQYISQMDESVRNAIFGNVGTLVAFRVGAEDAEYLAKEFSPEFTAEDIVNLTKYNVYLKLMIDGVSSHPFSAEVLPPLIIPKESNRDKIISASREKYGVKKEIVEEKILHLMGIEDQNRTTNNIGKSSFNKGHEFVDSPMKPELITPKLPKKDNTKKLEKLFSTIFGLVHLKTLKDFELKNKKVLVRCDFNVPLDDDGNILDDFKIKESLPTIKYLIEKEAKIILMSHLGELEGKIIPSLTLNKVKDKLEDLLGITILKANDCIGKEVKTQADALKSKEVLLLENLKFHKEEIDNDAEFAKQLSTLADIYINDAFASCHRAYASIVGIPKYLTHGAGLLLEREVRNLKLILENPKKPVLVIIGGVKLETKMKFINNILKVADYIIINGLIKKEIMAKELIFQYPEKIISPVDFLEAPDISNQTITLFTEKIMSAGTILWNGPFGRFEDDQYKKGTLAIANAIIKSGAFSVVGGGQTVEFLNKEGIASKFNHISTGGGAMLDYLSGDVLPGLEALE